MRANGCYNLITAMFFPSAFLPGLFVIISCFILKLLSLCVCSVFTSCLCVLSRHFSMSPVSISQLVFCVYVALSFPLMVARILGYSYWVLFALILHVSPLLPGLWPFCLFSAMVSDLVLFPRALRWHWSYPIWMSKSLQWAVLEKWPTFIIFVKYKDQG